MKEAFDWIYTIADANSIKEIKILSLNLGDSNLNKQAKDNYRRLKNELLQKGIQLKWAVIEKRLINDSHDRWIIGGNSTAWNIPNVNAISAGQRSELNRSDNYYQITKAFNDYWNLSKEVVV